MRENKVAVTTDCVCDLPNDMLEKLGVDMVYFYIVTDTGRFRDVDEISATNIFDYMENGGKKSVSTAPPPEEYKAFFEKKLEMYTEVVHVCIGSGISLSYKFATEAIEKMGEKGKHVHLIDSGHLSTGLGHLVIRAAEMSNSGCNAESIVHEVNDMRNRVTTTFIAKNADYLYNNGKVSKTVKNLCSGLNIHPVLGIKDGALCLKNVRIGRYDSCCGRYIRDELKDSGSIERNRLFITHAGCTAKEVAFIKSEISKYCTFEEIIVTKASATVSSNCGPHTFGVLFVRR